MSSSVVSPSEPVRQHEILEQIRTGFISVLSCQDGESLMDLDDIEFSDDTGDSTVMFVKDELLPRHKDVLEWTSSLRKDGSWPDIQYMSRLLSRFPAVEHLRRIRAMARVSAEECVIVAVRKALGYWFSEKPKSEGWWWNEIGVPLQLGAVLLLLEPILGLDELEKGLVLLDSCQIQRTGQNRVWSAVCVLMRATLRRNFEEAMRARIVLGEELNIVREGEGIQSDWSYHLHGRQPQFGNYGLSFAIAMSRVAAVFKGTMWACSDKELDVLGSYVERGLEPVVWKGRMDLASIGRQLNHGASRMKALAISVTRKRLAQVYRKPLAAGVREGLVWYDQSACGVYRTANWMCSFKCETASIQGVEHVNEDNPLGAHLADGAIYLYATGHEYDDVYLYWDWSRIPGVTSYERDAVAWPPRNSSDDLTVDGRTVRFVLSRDGLAVSKEVCFTSEGVDVRVRGITSSDPRAVVTTIEQCRVCENASVGFVGDRRVAINGAFKYNLPLSAEVQIRHGAASNAEGDLFEIVVWHGVLPKEASCEWSVRYLTEEQAIEEVRNLHRLERPSAGAPRVLIVSNGDPNVLNPFVSLTVRELQNRGFVVDSGVRRFFAGAEGYDFVHFEWPEDLVSWDLGGVTSSQLDEIEARIRRLKRFGVVLTYTRHNSKPHTAGGALIERLYRIVEENVDAVFHMGEYSRQELRSSRPSGLKIADYIVPHHLPISVYDPCDRIEARNALAIDPEAEVVVAFGAFRNADEVRLTKDAFAGCMSARKVLLAPRMEDDANKTDNRTLALMLSAADVIFIQRVSILNSGNLPLGFMYGKVVVGPRCGNVGEILKVTGNPVFNPDNIKDASRAIDRGFELARAEKGKKNRDYAFAHWLPDQIGELMAGAYDDLIRRQGEVVIPMSDVRAVLREQIEASERDAFAAKALKNEIAKRNWWLKEKAERLAEAHEAIAKRDGWLKEKAERLAEAHEAITKRDGWVKEKAQRLAEAHEAIAKRDGWLKEKVAKASELSEIVRRQEAELKGGIKRISSLESDAELRIQKIKQLEADLVYATAIQSQQQTMISDLSERPATVAGCIRYIFKLMWDSIEKK